MDRRQHIRKKLGQNFLTSEKLVRGLVSGARIGIEDTVLDIGAGRGIITAELARRAKRVFAIEKDPRLADALRRRFRADRNVEITRCDFLRYRIPVRDYKVFASIPYNQTAAIVRRLLESPRHAPVDASLIIQKEPARRFAGIPRETLFSLLTKPYFEVRIVRHLDRMDFSPVPDVDSVLLRITRRNVPLLEDGERYRDFVRNGFLRYKPNLRLAYKQVFSYKQWKRLARELRFSINATPTELSVDQWLGLFRAARHESAAGRKQ